MGGMGRGGVMTGGCGGKRRGGSPGKMWSAEFVSTMNPAAKTGACANSQPSKAKKESERFMAD